MNSSNSRSLGREWETGLETGRRADDAAHMRHGPWHKRRPAVTSVPPPAGHHSALSGEELLPSVATWPHESDHDSTLGRGVGLAAPLAGQRSERPQKNKAHGSPVASAQFSTEMALNDLETIGESIVMVENGSVR